MNQPRCPRRNPLPCDSSPRAFDRRSLLIGGGAVAAGAIGYPLARRLLAEKTPVFLAKNQRYNGPLEQTISNGLKAVGFDFAWLKGRRVLLKPNLVEPTRACPHMTTHPAVVVAAAEVFRRHGAQVVVGEGPGHVRDTQMALDESGVGEALESAGLEFVDINYEETIRMANAGKNCPLESFHFPRAAAAADLIVSLPKLKTHHWVGITAAMKNLYGLLPGIKYGWPKNVLHHAGIPQSVVDINASLPKVIGIVDAIDCMEGDGPIMGSRKPLGMLAVGLNPTALDATCARIMGLEPSRIDYLRIGQSLGPVADWRIEQRGEPWRRLHSPFEMLDQPHLNRLRT